jgi:hypothetical protein
MRNNIDEVIDDVAREMTGAPMGRVDEGEGLAQRVLARIEAGIAERDTRTWRLAWLLAPAAVVSVVALGVLVSRQPARAPIVQTRPGATSETAGETAGEAAAGAQTVTVPPDGATGQRAPAPAEALRTAATGSTSSRGPAAARPASPSLEPLTLAPIVLEKVDVPPLVAARPIEISTIALERIELSEMP